MLMLMKDDDLAWDGRAWHSFVRIALERGDAGKKKEEEIEGERGGEREKENATTEPLRISTTFEKSLFIKLKLKALVIV